MVRLWISEVSQGAEYAWKEYKYALIMSQYDNILLKTQEAPHGTILEIFQQETLKT